MTDYAALANQLGGTEGGTDYAALAKELGGVPATPKAHDVSWRMAAEAAGIPVGYAMDAGMGLKQALDAVAQMAARGAEGAANSIAPNSDIAKTLTGMRQDTERANQNTLDAYNNAAQPDSRPGAGLVRGVGQSLPMFALPALKAAGVLGNAAMGAGMGAVGGALEPVYDAGDNFLGAKGGQIAQGAAAGGALGGLGAIAAKAIAPKIGAAQSALRDANINLTPGQAAGGMMKSFEDKLTGFPLIGDLINARRFQGITDFNRAIYSKAVEPFGAEGAAVAKSADVGNAGIKKVGDFLSSKYEQALSQSVPAPVSREFQAELSQLTSLVPRNLRDDFGDIIKRTVMDNVTPAGTLTPSVARAADSELGRLAASYKGSSVASEREFATALAQAQESVRDLFAQANPEVAPIIQAANQGWRTLVQMENAGAMQGAKDGIFTPSQFLNAVKKSDKSLRDRQFARGDAFNQEFAQAADKVLPNKVADSGTPGRLTAGAVIAEGARAIPGMAAATVAGLPYMPGIGPLLMRLAIDRPQGAATLRSLAQGALPYLGAPVGAMTASP